MGNVQEEVELRDFVVAIAEELDIAFQYTTITGGGTDAISRRSNETAG